MAKSISIGTFANHTVTINGQNPSAAADMGITTSPTAIYSDLAVFLQPLAGLEVPNQFGAAALQSSTHYACCDELLTSLESGTIMVEGTTKYIVTYFGIVDTFAGGYTEMLLKRLI